MPKETELQKGLRVLRARLAKEVKPYPIQPTRSTATEPPKPGRRNALTRPPDYPPEEPNQGAEMTTVAYDFDDEIHVLQLDELGAHEGEPVILPRGGQTRDEVLDTWGYRTLGAWTMQGEAEGVEVVLR